MSSFETAPKPRATIYVDSSMLMILNSTIPKEFLVDNVYVKRPTYYDIFKFLGKHGFDVVIPEIVSFESGDVLNNGFRITNLFRASQRSVSKKNTFVGTFLQEVADGKIPGVRIEPPVKGSPSFALLSKLHECVDEYQTYGHVGTLSNQRHVLYTARSNIIAAQKIDKTHMGDEEIKRIIKTRYSKPDPSSPFFVFTNDKDMLTHDKDMPIQIKKRAVSSRRLMYGLALSELKQAIGIDASISHESLTQNVSENVTYSTPSPDFEPEKQESYATKTKSTPFFAALFKLAEDLKKAPPPPQAAAVENTDSPPVGKSRIAKFNERYNRRPSSDKQGRG